MRSTECPSSYYSNTAARLICDPSSPDHVTMHWSTLHVCADYWICCNLSLCHNDHPHTPDNPPGDNPLLLPYVGQLGSGSCLVGRIGSPFFLSLFLSFTRWHMPLSRTSAETCIMGWPNAQPQVLVKCDNIRLENTDFPDVIKFCIAVHTLWQKSTRSGMQTMIRIGPKS